MGERKKGRRTDAAKKERKQTSLKIDPALHRRAQHYAIDQGKLLSDVFDEALEEYLKKQGA